MPELLEIAAQIGTADRLIIRQEHRDQPGVGGTLHVVLAAQRMQSGAGAADLPRNQRQRDQAARIVGPVDVLADAHAPEDDRGFCARIHPGDLAQGVRWNAADRRHLLRRELLDLGLQLVEAFGIAGDILLVGQALGDDRVDHRVQHRDVAARLEGEMLGGVARQRLAARIHHDQLGAVLGRILDEGRGDRMVHGRIRADHDYDLGIKRRREWRRHRTGVEAFHQRRDG
jgi:hypothetical protein